MKFKFDDPPRNKKPKHKEEQQMSVKQMSTDQLQDDLESIAQTWPNGVPEQQSDRVNALKGELKRRGEEVRRAAPPKTNGNGSKPKSIKSMNDEQLEAELRKLSTAIGVNPKDEELQERHANVRYEMRQRNAAGPSVAPRSIEIPDEDEPEKARQIESPRVQEDKRKLALNGVNGFSAQAGGRGVVLRYTATEGDTTILQVASSLSVEEAEAHIANVQAAIKKHKSDS
jgi:hypothetical protein